MLIKIIVNVIEENVRVTHEIYKVIKRVISNEYSICKVMQRDINYKYEQQKCKAIRLAILKLLDSLEEVM